MGKKSEIGALDIVKIDRVAVGAVKYKRTWCVASVFLDENVCLLDYQRQPVRLPFDAANIVLLAKRSVEFRKNTISDAGNVYEIGKLFGSGSYGSVWEVTCAGHPKAAMKAKRKKAGRKLIKLIMEVEVLKRMAGNSMFPTLIASAAHRDLAFIVMDLVGPSLESLIEENNNEIPYASAVKVAGEVLKGLRYLHEAGIVHRDLKVANIACRRGSDRGKIVVIDFGLARIYMQNN